jgi:hypothetical protein
MSRLLGHDILLCVFSKATSERLSLDVGDLLENGFLFSVKLILDSIEAVLGGDVLDEDLLPTLTEDLIAGRDEDAGGILRRGLWQLIDCDLGVRVRLQEGDHRVALDC